MTALTISLICLSVFLALSLCVSIYFNIKFGILILKFQDALEESLDILDEKYLKIGSILEKPIFFDSMEVRQVISDIKGSRDSILKVANILTHPTEDKAKLRIEDD